MAEMPKRMVIVGGECDAVELAQIMQGLGVKVTLLVPKQMLAFIDDDIRHALFENMKLTGLDVKIKTTPKKILKNLDGTLNIIINTGHIVQCDMCINLDSQSPALGELAIEKTKIKHDKVV